MTLHPRISKRWTWQYNFKTSFLEMTVRGKRLRYVASSKVARWRVRTLFEKEPTTMVWLDSFKPGEVLVDIGANVGMYSIYAAAISGARVYSFEPESQSFGELNRNIFVNKLHGQVTAYPLAISDERGFSIFHLSRFGVGWGEHNLGEPNPEWPSAFAQGSVSATLDELVASGAIPQPNHVKIDVDGLEWRVFRGMEKTLASQQLKSVLIETNFKLDKSVEIIAAMQALGWRFSRDQARVNQHEIVPYEEIERRIRARTHGQNYIYYRDPSYDRLFADFAEKFVPPNPNKGTFARKIRPKLGKLKRRLLREE